MKLIVAVGEKEILKKTKISSATSPNVVHMLDSQIVAGVVLKAGYTVFVYPRFIFNPCCRWRKNSLTIAEKYL